MSQLPVLLVDSDTDLLNILGSFLNSQGFRVSATSRAREAISKLSVEEYSVIVLEPDLKGERGDDVIRSATSDASGLNSKTPVVLLTSSLDYRMPKNVLPNVKSVVLKPFQFEDLLGSIQAVLAENHQTVKKS